MALRDIDVAEKSFQEALERLLQDMTVAQRLAGLSPEQRLAGLTPEQLLAALSPDVREVLATKLRG